MSLHECSTAVGATDQIAQARKRFATETADHQMTVLKDDGLYRHLRFQKPGTWCYGFDLVTWPGYLAVVGDCGDFVFSRTRDMVDFFSPSGGRGGFEDARWGINPHYWAEKLQGPGPAHQLVEVFAPAAFAARAREWLESYIEDHAAPPDRERELRQCLEDDVLCYVHDGEHAVSDALVRFAEDALGGWGDAWELSAKEWDWQYLWCCWAIVWGLGRYHAARPEA
jgi:hypothetical protein